MLVRLDAPYCHGMSGKLTRFSIESSLEVVQELHGSNENDGIRARLRERDELAMQLLNTLLQLDTESSRNQACLDKISKISPELKKSTLEEMTPRPKDESLCKLQLLKGVILVCEYID